jgi:hypothetical protein
MPLRFTIRDLLGLTLVAACSFWFGAIAPLQSPLHAACGEKMNRRQFNLRMLFLAVTLIAIVLAVIFAKVRANREAYRVEEIRVLEWTIAHPDQWKAVGPNSSQYMDIMQKRLAEIKQ